MRTKANSTVLNKMRGVTTFLVPKKLSSAQMVDFQHKKIAAVIPTYKPTNVTYSLVKNISTWHTNIQIIIVDDHTPLTDSQSMHVFEKIRTLAATTKNITILRTPEKYLKASALNMGLEHIATLKTTPEFVVTFDDDVSIKEYTLPRLINTLAANAELGIACSTTWVKNKKKNLLTRLQSLEYHNFTITKIGDNGFLLGPLVMQGMLSAFRYEAIKAVEGFAPDKLIEDYDITVRVKNAGWQTAIVPEALAWTVVPENLQQLWKQRIRWTYGGVIVVKDYWRQYLSILQDIIGHAIFISLFSLIMASFVFTKHATTSPLLILALFAVATIHFMLGFTFNVLTLLSYPERDHKDWFLKLSLFPEFVYSNMLNALLLGSYLFFLFNITTYYLVKVIPFFKHVQKAGTKTFSKFGYSVAWGTRA